MEHKHIYDKDGKQLCCTQEEKINMVANKQLKKEHKEVGCCAIDEPKHDEHSDDDGHDHSGGNESTFKMFLPAIISLALLLIAIALDLFPSIVVYRLGSDYLVWCCLLTCWFSRAKRSNRKHW